MSAKTHPFIFEIPRRNSVCSARGEIFSSGEQYYSVVNEKENGAYNRQDFCASCWEIVAQDVLDNKSTFWKAKIQEKKKDACSYKNRDDQALQLLKEVNASSVPEELQESFILALYLARKRLIAQRQQLQQDSGQVLILYEVLATEDMIAVLKLDFAKLDIQAIQQRLASKLKK